eukprot:PhF_6_TR25423/c1_g1_i2/m.35138
MTIIDRNQSRVSHISLGSESEQMYYLNTLISKIVPPDYVVERKCFPSVNAVKNQAQHITLQILLAISQERECNEESIEMECFSSLTNLHRLLEPKGAQQKSNRAN